MLAATRTNAQLQQERASYTPVSSSPSRSPTEPSIIDLAGVLRWRPPVNIREHAAK